MVDGSKLGRLMLTRSFGTLIAGGQVFIVDGDVENGFGITSESPWTARIISINIDLSEQSKERNRR